MSEVKYTPEAHIRANDLDIAYDTFGVPTNPAILLVMGLGMQLVGWDEVFCSQLAQQGFYVIRYDNRDVGRSTRLEAAGPPPFLRLALALRFGLKLSAPYLLRDMAEDAIGLLDALGIGAAHVVGVSMGGMIAQEVAIHHRPRVLSLTSIMSSTGARKLPAARPKVLRILFSQAPEEREAYISHSFRNWQVTCGRTYPANWERVQRLAGAQFDRGRYPVGTARQLAAIAASGDRTAALRQLDVPTLVIHGTADPLVRVEHGVATAAAIPNARLMLIDGLGHSLPPELFDQIIAAIVQLAAQAQPA